VLRIRMQRLGRRNRPCYRIVVIDGRSKRQGEYLENVGTYDPISKDATKEIKVMKERIDHWVKLGAQMSDSVKLLVKRASKQAAAPAKA
jgi:small subunit ribosomal protein S16